MPDSMDLSPLWNHHINLKDKKYFVLLFLVIIQLNELKKYRKLNRCCNFF